MAGQMGYRGFWARVWHLGNGLRNSENKRVKALGYRISDFAIKRRRK